jgi:hypothetical protein
MGGETAIARAGGVMPRVVQWRYPEAQHAMPNSPTHHIQAALCTHQYSQALLPLQPSSPCAEIIIGLPHT